MHAIVDQIVEVFATRGAESYGSEDVTQLEHAMQCGDLARSSKATDELVVAAVLHDIGHLLLDTPLPTADASDYDDSHETIGYQFLEQNFGAAVADPVRLHVAAKRYLCTTRPSYEQQLSPTSYKSYLDQGGKMSKDELAAFESEPHCEAALVLRSWDDSAKNMDAKMPTIEDFKPYFFAVLQQQRQIDS
ncbi:HD domain-containing protein [Roseiconus lacunae]|uniref:HD domain-containing protein n=1 Tax=Roseiconus lacunae TaxID=2605694 RepID=A0ABT7PL13_9BACT|nr:HD domain-containing protein [Roseiconus lacunae]MCD0462732.1 HD domain-containing protein [Roseiconus lacunae]MDM4017181.1 HD domain-containing protein [Roseiconus lacunae]WRQ51243.1 HD domain-containing protein [Stieleria sp. HD01]